MSQKILVIRTENNLLRSEATNRWIEDSAWFPHKNDTSLTQKDVSHITSPLHAMALGWILMAPPVDASYTTTHGVLVHGYEWWFTKITKEKSNA